jgi:hypothetical protein
MSKLEVDKITPQSGTTLTIGDSGDTIVIDSTSVSGAKLAAPTLVGSASSAGSILFKEDTDNGTNSVTLKGPAATADVTLTLPAATDTVVGRQTTDTLTNKTINASQLVDASIATGKLADDAVTYAKMQDTSTANRVLGAASAGTISEVQIATDMIVDANVTTAKINDNAVTLAKMASGTDGNIISYDASGNPVAVATGSDGQVLTSTGAGSPPAFEAAPSGGMVLLTSADITSNTSQIAISSTYINDTYEHYQLWIRGKDAGDGPQFFMRYKNNADDATIESGYAYRVGSLADNGSGTNSDSASAILLSQDNMGNGANEGFNMTLDFMSSRSALVPTSVHYNINLADTSDAFQANQGMARLNDATVRNSGFVLFYGNGGDFANGTNYEFYGMKK